MLLNHNRKKVKDCEQGEESNCPECSDGLTAKRGQIKIWHWSHRPDSACGYGAQESEWHITWKEVVSNIGYEIEYPFEIDGAPYRFDAYNPKTNNVIEFVHSMSDAYLPKFNSISQKTELSQIWIWDGDRFASLRHSWKWSSLFPTGAIRRFLKPGTQDLYDAIGGLIHFCGELWEFKEFSEDIISDCAHIHRFDEHHDHKFYTTIPGDRLQQVFQKLYLDPKPGFGHTVMVPTGKINHKRICMEFDSAWGNRE